MNGSFTSLKVLVLAFGSMTRQQQQEAKEPRAAG